MSTTLPLFWHLSSNSRTDRIEASVKLIGALEQFQSKFTPFPPETSSEDEDEDEEELGSEPGVSSDGLDGPNSPDVSYSIRRLVRGLASPRESSRLGFAVALTELLSRLDTVSASQIISLLSQSSKTNGFMKGQEERDTLFARLFGITALIQSGVLFCPTPLPTSSNLKSTLNDFRDAMEMLLALPTRKSFLKEPSYWALITTIRSLATSEVGWKEEAWSWVVEKVFIEDKSWSPEKVGVVLTMQSLGIEIDWETFLTPVLKNGDILSSGNSRNLAKILTETDIESHDVDAAKTKSSAGWKPQLHFVWNLILDIYFPPPGTVPSKIKCKTSFPEFFRVAVDDSLLASNSSAGRKLWGFELFRLSLTRLPASELPRIFTPNFMRSWINHLSKPDRYLHKAAKLVASSLPPIIAADPSAGFPVLLQLLRTHGHFDRLTRTRTVESLLAAMDVKGVEEYVLHLGGLACRPLTKTDGADNEDPTTTRIWVADQLTALIRNGTIPQSDIWVSNILKFLVLHSLFGIKKKNEKSHNRWLHVISDPAFSDEARTACRMRLLTCIAELTSQATIIKIGEKSVRSTGVASNGELWVSKILLEIIELEKDTKHVLRLGLDDEEVRQEVMLRDRTLDAVKKLKTLRFDRAQACEGVELLLISTLLYRYLGDDKENDGDIEACLNNIARLFPVTALSPDKRNKKHQPADDEVDTEEDVAPIDALVDTLIGYLEKSTSYLRVVANQVFGLLTGLVNRSTVDLILAQLERRDPSRDDDEEEMAGTEDEDAHSDEDSLDSSLKSHDSEGSEDIEEDPELRRKIEEALRVNGIQAATEGAYEDSESVSSNDVIMDDDQMMQLDEHLAEIFRSRTKERGRVGSGAQREATHFKNRVLDLVDIFLRKEPTSKYAPAFILPLVYVITGTGPDERQLSDKVTGLLRNRFGKTKEVPTSIDLTQTRKILEDLHIMARKAHSPDVRETISACSLYTARILLSEPIQDEKTVVDVYRASLCDFATRKASILQPSFVQDFVRRQPRSAWRLRNDIVHFAENAVNVYRKCQTFQLLGPLFNQLSSIDCDELAVTDFIKTFRQAVYTVLSDACEDPESLNTSQVKELLKLSLLIARQTKRTIANLADLPKLWGDSELSFLSQKLKSSRFKAATSLNNLCRQLLTAVGANLETVDKEGEKVDRGNQKKRKVEEVHDMEKKTRRKKTKTRC